MNKNSKTSDKKKLIIIILFFTFFSSTAYSRSNNLDFSIMGSIRSDSNATLEASEEAKPEGGKDTNKLIIFKTTYDKKLNSAMRSKFSYSYYVSFYDKKSDLNLQGHFWNTAFIKKYGKNSILTSNFNYFLFLLEGNSYYGRFLTDLHFRIARNRKNDIEFFVEFEKKHYFSSSEMSSKCFGVGIKQYVFFYEKGFNIDLSYLYERENANFNDFSYVNDEILLNVTKDLPYELKLKFLSKLNFKRYDRNFTDRKDDRLQYSIQLYRKFKEKHTFSIGIIMVDNNSNININSYKRKINFFSYVYDF